MDTCTMRHRHIEPLFSPVEEGALLHFQHLAPHLHFQHLFPFCRTKVGKKKQKKTWWKNSKIKENKTLQYLSSCTNKIKKYSLIQKIHYFLLPQILIGHWRNILNWGRRKGRRRQSTLISNIEQLNSFFKLPTCSLWNICFIHSINDFKYNPTLNTINDRTLKQSSTRFFFFFFYVFYISWAKKRSIEHGIFEVDPEHGKAWPV